MSIIQFDTFYVDGRTRKEFVWNMDYFPDLARIKYTVLVAGSQLLTLLPIMPVLVGLLDVNITEL